LTQRGRGRALAGWTVLPGAFTSEKVRALTGLSPRQLQYWDEQKFLSPSLRRQAGTGRRRLYDFRDLVSLRVATDLRHVGVSLQLIRTAVTHLRELDYEHPLSELRFWEVNGRLYFEEAGTVREARRPGQTIAGFAIPLGEILDELEQGIVQLDYRVPGRVERRHGTLGSKPLIAGTRIPVESVHRLRDDGADEKEILRLYPDLSAADVRAALAEELQPRVRRKRAS
jgi:DNA-binding transcriptional MerR regulator